MLELQLPYLSSCTSCGYSMITLDSTYMKHGEAQHTESLSLATTGLTQANIEFLRHQKLRQ